MGYFIRPFGCSRPGLSFKEEWKLVPRDPAMLVMIALCTALILIFGR